MQGFKPPESVMVYCQRMCGENVFFLLTNHRKVTLIAFDQVLMLLNTGSALEVLPALEVETL